MIRTFLITLLAIYSMLSVASEPSEKVWSGEIELGYGNSSGNSDTSNTISKIVLNGNKGIFKYSIQADTYRASDSGQITAERYFLSNQLNGSIDAKNYLFGYASYDRDLFSGYDYQSSLSVGYGRSLLDSDTVIWTAEAGPGYAYTKIEGTETTDAQNEDNGFLRLATNYRWQLSEYSSFSEDFWVEAGDNTTSRSVTSISARVIGELLIKLSYTAKYTEIVPTDKENTDTETTVTALYNF